MLLLNAVLTVESGLSNSHQNKGWERFTDRAVQILGQIKLVGDANRTDFYKGIDGLFRRNDQQIAQRDENAKVTAGALEGSNVNVVESLVQMIDHARHYDLSIKMMQTADQNAKSATSIMSMSS